MGRLVTDNAILDFKKEEHSLKTRENKQLEIGGEGKKKKKRKVT